MANKRRERPSRAKPTVEVIVNAGRPYNTAAHTYEVRPAQVQAFYGLLDAMRADVDLPWGHVVAKLWDYVRFDPEPSMVKASLVEILYALETWPAAGHIGKVDS